MVALRVTRMDLDTVAIVAVKIIVITIRDHCFVGRSQHMVPLSGKRKKQRKHDFAAMVYRELCRTLIRNCITSIVVLTREVARVVGGTAIPRESFDEAWVTKQHDSCD